MSLTLSNYSKPGNLAPLLLNALMSGAVRALVDAVGSDEAFKRLDPYIRINAKWCAQNFPAISRVRPYGCEGAAGTILFAVYMSNRGNPNAKASSAQADIVHPDCRTNGQFPFYCEWWCRKELCLILKETTPSVTITQIASMDKGDQACHWHIVEKEEPTSHTAPLNDLPLPVTPTEELDFMCQAGPGEFWNNATATTVDLLGEERAARLLNMQARRIGEEYGIACLRLDEAEIGSTTLESAFHRLDAIWGRRAEWKAKDENSLTREIHDCPFASTAASVCGQLEAFWNGVCDVVAPGWSASYASRRDQGAKSCIMILQRDQTAPGNRKEGKSARHGGEDPLTIIRLRYARGEITKAEYLEQKEVLSDK